MALNPLNRIAAEILFEIVSNTSPMDQIVLSKVSKTLNAVATKFLYRHIVLTSFKHIFRCCTTLDRRAEAALSVRTLSFDLLGHEMISGKWDAGIFEPFFRMINRALYKTTRLYSLVLRLPHDPHGVTLQQCTFPLLNHYGSTFDAGGDFVERHPMIKNITVLGEGAVSTTAFNAGHISSLNVFSGPAHLVPVVIPGRPVHSAKLWWPLYPCYDTAEDGLDCWHSQDVIRSLAQSAFPDGIVVLENLFMDWPPLRTLGALAASLTLRVLFIHSRNCGESAYNAFLLDLTTILSQFQQLQELRVSYLCPTGASLNYAREEVANLVEEFWTVREWADRCPTLCVCTLQCSVPWMRFRLTSPSYWIPAHPKETVFARVFVHTLWTEGLQSRRAWDKFCQNTLALSDQLPRESGQFMALHPFLMLLEAIGEFVPSFLKLT